MTLAPDLSAPPPGTPVVLLARCASGGKVTAVALELSGPPTGAWLDRWVDVARRLALVVVLAALLVTAVPG